MIVRDVGTINDSGMSETEVRKHLRDGVIISYGQMTVLVQKAAFNDALDHVKKLNFKSRFNVTQSVRDTLEKSLPIMEAGTFDKEMADNFHSDLLIWEALKRTAS